MKKIVLIITTILVTLPILAGLSSSKPILPLSPLTAEPDFDTLERLTIYNPTKGQCDASPLRTANNSLIDLDKLFRKELRWMALSRDMLKRWNGAYNYGDTIEVFANDPVIDGLWVINDTMNKRYKNSGDLLVHHTMKTQGLWKNVRITNRSVKKEPIEIIDLN